MEEILSEMLKKKLRYIRMNLKKTGLICQEK